MSEQLTLGECLEQMALLPDASIDAIITDPPYGTTACRWDSVIPFEPMWTQLKRIIKPRGALVLFGSQPFTSALIMSNIKWFKYCWVWDKVAARGHLVAKYRPMQQTEDIIIFGEDTVNYYPILDNRDNPRTLMEYSRTKIMGGKSNHVATTTSYYNPRTLLRFSNANRSGNVHPTQKPVKLMEYLIKTYTLEGETVLDFTMGSGSTGVACKNTGRNFIGIEQDESYFDIAGKRIASAVRQLELGL